MMKAMRNKLVRTILSIILVATIALSAFLAGNDLIVSEGSNNKTIGIALIVIGIIGLAASVISKNKDNKKY
jgi:hypothetical protein